MNLVFPSASESLLIAIADSKTSQSFPCLKALSLALLFLLAVCQPRSWAHHPSKACTVTVICQHSPSFLPFIHSAHLISFEESTANLSSWLHFRGAAKAVSFYSLESPHLPALIDRCAVFILEPADVDQARSAGSTQCNCFAKLLESARNSPADFYVELSSTLITMLVQMPKASPNDQQSN